MPNASLFSAERPASYPEVFPPGAEIPPAQYTQPSYGYQPPPPPPQPRGRRRGWASAPATYLLVGINCVVFLLMLLNGVSLMSPTTANSCTGVPTTGSLFCKAIGGAW